MKLIGFIFVIIFAVNVEVTSIEIKEEVIQYFESATVKEFEKQWLKQKKSIESAITLVLLESYGRPSMNIYHKKAPDPHRIADGFYLFDNVVELLLLNLTLRDLPHLRMPEVSFHLDKNVLRLEGGLTKMFIEAEYLLFRNHSKVLYSEGHDHDAYKFSPFSFQQVQTVGQLAIIAEGCSLIGSSITTLIGQTVNLGYSTLRITDCKFSVEIYNHGSGQPPVIAPYFSKEQGLQLELLLAKPIVDEVTVKLQGALFTYINTTSILGKDLMKFRHHQEKIFKKTSDYMVNVVRNMNKFTVERNQGRIQLNDFQVYWYEKAEIGDETRIVLTNMSVNGLDTAYSTNKGGPYNWRRLIQIGESIRFNTMHVRGKIRLEKGTEKSVHDFAAELHDVTIAVTVQINMEQNDKDTLKASKTINRYQVVDWRAMEYTILHLNVKEHIMSHALVSGYLLNEIPKCLVSYLSKNFPKAASKASVDEELGGLDENNKTPDIENNDVVLNEISDDKVGVTPPPFRYPNVKLKMRIITKKGIVTSINK